jgi:hypothetical protein
MTSFSRASVDALRDATAAVRAMRAPLLLAIAAFYVLSERAVGA